MSEDQKLKTAVEKAGQNSAQRAADSEEQLDKEAQKAAQNKKPVIISVPQSPGSVKIMEEFTKDAILGISALDKKLLDLFRNEPGLQAKLLEAFETERWFVTVHFQKKYKPTDEHDQHHFLCHKAYPLKDIPASLKNVASNFIVNELPNADIPDDGGWH